MRRTRRALSDSSEWNDKEIIRDGTKTRGKKVQKMNITEKREHERKRWQKEALIASISKENKRQIAYIWDEIFHTISQIYEEGDTFSIEENLDEFRKFCCKNHIEVGDGYVITQISKIPRSIR